MSGDGFKFEYPDEAGYPDGMGTLHEGTDDGTKPPPSRPRRQRSTTSRSSRLKTRKT